jgi:glycosyl transferase, family 25
MSSAVHVYVINLARSLDRRAHITAELDKTGLDYDIVAAVDGRVLDLTDPTIVDPALVARIQVQLVAGTVGAALSHQKVYQQIIADGVDIALVLEDDVVLPADLKTLADAVAGQLDGAEVALLSYDSEEPCRMSREGLVPLPGSRSLALPIDIDQPVSGAGYLITREACERMIKYGTPIRVPADTWRFFFREGALDRVRCVFPLPVLKNPKFTSTIGSYSAGSGIKGRLVLTLVRSKIPILHQVLTYRKQRIYRQWGRSELVDIPFKEKPSRLD